MATRKRAARKGGPAPSRSGTRLTEAQRLAAGSKPLKVRLSLERHAQLAWLVERTGYTRTDIIDGHIRQEYEEQRALDAQLSARRGQSEQADQGDE